MEFAKFLLGPKRIKYFIKTWLVAAATGWLTVGSLATVQASTIVELNTGKVPVEDRSSRSLNTATKKAIEQLLVKLTGKEDINEYQAVNALRDNANRYLRAYRFTQENDQLYLVAEFDRELIESAIVKASLPIWGSRRPDAMLWLVIEDDEGNRTIVDDGNSTDIANTVRRQVEQRGTPLALPLMDLDDTLQINGYDVWGLFPSQLLNASQRYNVDYVLAARLYQNRTQPIVYSEEQVAVPAFVLGPLPMPALRVTAYGEVELPLAIERDAIQMSWLEPAVQSGPLFTQDEFSTIAARAKKGRYSLDYLYLPAAGPTYNVIHQTLIGDDPNDLIGKFINDYANYLGQSFAILPGASDAMKSVEISIGNMSDLEKFVAVQRYLQTLTVTENVTLIKHQGTVSTFKLNLLGTEQDLRSVLTLDNQLQPLTDAFGQPLEGMHYFWSR